MNVIGSDYNIVRTVLFSGQECPVHGIIIDIVNFEGSNYAYRLYRDNISDYSDSQIESVYTWLKEKATIAEKLSNAKVGIDIGESSSLVERLDARRK